MQLLLSLSQQDNCKEGSTKKMLNILTPIFRLTSMELTQIHDLIIQLFGLLKKKGHMVSDVSAETFFDWLIQTDTSCETNSGAASNASLNKQKHLLFIL